MANTWQNPSFTNGAYGNAQFAIFSATGGTSNLVLFRGSMTAPAGQTAFTLPTNAKPLQAQRLPAFDPGSLRPVVVSIDASGNVSVNSPQNNGSGTEMIFVSLDGLGPSPGEQ